MTSLTEISATQLSRLIGLPTAPVLIDVRIDEDVASSPVLIPTAKRHSHRDIGGLGPELLGKRVVVICHKGAKLSQGAAAILRTEGIGAETLEGGHVGWLNAGLPTVDLAAYPAPDASGRTVWVTRHRPKIDRIACPWLIRRFVDPKARFLFVEGKEVRNVAERFEATPFDVEDVALSHKDDLCTFDTMLDTFGLKTDALATMANIVRGADTNRHDLAPQVSGLLAISLGLSRMFRDDLEQLEAGLTLYDALYRWARDATRESHEWPAKHTS